MAASVRKGELAEVEENWITQRSEELLAVMGLLHRRDDLAKKLPYGEQRRLEIARALATDPKALLLDEPAAGTNQKEKSELMQLIRDIRDRFGVAIVLIEHDMKLVMACRSGSWCWTTGSPSRRGSRARIQTNRG